MGSVCCVPAKNPQQQQQRSGGGMASEPTHWRINGNYSPPLSGRWEGKSFPEEANNSLHLYRSSFSSSSRGGSRRGSSRFQQQQHQRALSGNLYSPEPSPSSSFRATHVNHPINSSQICPLVVDLPPLPSEPNSSPCMTASSSKEGCLSGALSTPESTTPSFYSNCAEYPAPPVAPPKHSSNSFVSRFSRSSRPCASVGGGSSRSPLSEAGFSMLRRSPSGELAASPVTAAGAAGSDWWSMVTFSELVASSRRERLRWMSAGSGEELLENLETAPATSADVLTLERIKACGIQPGSVSPNNDALVCGLCSRWLSQRSPFSIHRMMGSLDLPGVGVLSCGHVFHADCLEQATCAAEKQDPPCPQCAVVRKMNRGLDAGDVSKGLFKSYNNSSVVAGAVRNKLSRVGVVNDDSLLEVGVSGGGGGSSSTGPSLKIFSPRGECQVKPEKGSGGGRASKRGWGRKPSSFSHVSSGDNRPAEDPGSTHHHSRKGSFSYLRGW